MPAISNGTRTPRGGAFDMPRYRRRHRRPSPCSVIVPAAPRPPDPTRPTGFRARSHLPMRRNAGLTALVVLLALVALLWLRPVTEAGPMPAAAGGPAPPTAGD